MSDRDAKLNYWIVRIEKEKATTVCTDLWDSAAPTVGSVLSSFFSLPSRIHGCPHRQRRLIVG